MPAEMNPYKYSPLFLTEEEQSNFYEGFSNEIIWPLFHDLQSRCNFDPRYWDFLRAGQSQIRGCGGESPRSPGDLIWVHDYQLMQVGQNLALSGAPMTQGWHSFSTYRSLRLISFAKLPWRQQILERPAGP